MNRRINVLLILILFFLTVCTSFHSHMAYSELTDYKAEMRIENNQLIIKLDNIPGLMVTEIDSYHDDGNIYLAAHRISSGSGIQEYKIDLSVHNLPADIIEHIYWGNPDSSKKQLYPEYLR